MTEGAAKIKAGIAMRCEPPPPIDAVIAAHDHDHGDVATFGRLRRRGVAPCFIGPLGIDATLRCLSQVQVLYDEACGWIVRLAPAPGVASPLLPGYRWSACPLRSIKDRSGRR